MTEEQFNQFWATHYPNSLPISHTFKHEYPDRWLRIHSLPESKRYAETTIEWEILLHRQNSLISDIFGEGLQVCLVTGLYSPKTLPAPNIRSDEVDSLKSYKFKLLEQIDLDKFSGEYFEEDLFYTPKFVEVIWESNRYDDLLKAVANYELIAFFVSFEQNAIIAPYDGGVDIIFKDVETKRHYQLKYHEWLSDRTDGL